MLLAFDIGNTSIHMGVFDGDVIKHTWRIGVEREVAKGLLVGTGKPTEVKWVYEIRRTHGGLETVPMHGTLTLTPTI